MTGNKYPILLKRGLLNTNELFSEKNVRDDKSMKKLFLILTLSLGVSVFHLASDASASENNSYPTLKEINQLNEELQILVDEANEKLENGEENIEVSSENMTLGFNVKDNTTVSKNNVGIQAIGSKSYQAFVANTSGFNFRHGVSGKFTWDGSLLKAITYVEDLSGTMYGKSASTNIQGVDGTIGRDAKIGKLTSKGTFTALKWSPISYYTTLVVDFYAPTKSYRIITAKISS